MRNWNKTPEDIKNDYVESVKQTACRFYFDKRNDNDTLLNDLYDRIEKEGGNVQFVSDVSAYIDALKDHNNKPFFD